MFYTRALELNADAPSQISGKIIQREKRNLFHEIELNDTGVICHKDINLTKSECITVIDELDDSNKKEFHFFIYQNRALNDFLCYGDLEFFEPFKAESIYKLPEFLDFISPYFAAQYDKVLGENYAQKVLQNLKKILSVKPITNESYFEACYRTTYSTLKDTDSQFNKIEDEISSGKSTFISAKFQGLESLILQKVDIKALNSLPSYFQGIQNQTAQTIRSISRAINNDPHNNYSVAFKLIDIANNIETDGLVKQNITKSHHIIKKNFDTQRQTDELLKKDPLMEKHLALILRMLYVNGSKMGMAESFAR